MSCCRWRPASAAAAAPLAALLCMLLAQQQGVSALRPGQVVWYPVFKNDCVQTCAKRNMLEVNGGTAGLSLCRRSDVFDTDRVTLFRYIGLAGAAKKFTYATKKGCFFPTQFRESDLCPMTSGYECACKQKAQARWPTWVLPRQCKTPVTYEHSVYYGEVERWRICRVKVGGRFVAGELQPPDICIAVMPWPDAQLRQPSACGSTVGIHVSQRILCEKLK